MNELMNLNLEGLSLSPGCVTLDKWLSSPSLGLSFIIYKMKGQTLEGPLWADALRFDDSRS